jgi:lipopolysaccharide export LptBFGC system permease protein LptF
MYPDNNPPQAPIDYLNQIAPQPKKPGINKSALIVVVLGIGLVLAIVIGFVVFATGSSKGPKTSTVTLAARMQAMQTVADKSQKNIKSSSLRGINSNLIIFLTNANRDIATPLTAAGLDVKKLDKTIVAKEKADPITADLEEARLNAIFDDTYAREMSFKLTTISLLMEDIYKSSKSKTMKDFLVTTDENLQPIKKQLDEFNSTTR